ncbi:MAG: rhodanese-like domain-containing protein [Arcicella sp.]|nr:rhodanese-like domain-containing protein [Arcicella sp.]
MFDFFKTKKNYEDVNASTFNILIKENPNAIIIDVRTPAEFKQNAIQGAINIDAMNSNFNQKIAELDKSKIYFIYCRSGNRSGSACKMMGNAGFENLYNLSGGLMKWVN